MDSYWFNLLLSLHILVGFCVIGLVLMQHGKGADMGAAFGSGASGSLFGASGSANFLSRVTAVLAAVFFTTSLILTYIVSERPKAPVSVIDKVKTDALPAKVETPAPAPSDSKAKDIPK